MRTSVLFSAGIILIISLATLPAGADENKINVVTTFPVLKDFVEQIGQNRVSAKSLVLAEDPGNAYTPRPDDILAVRNARILIQIGLGLETWVKGLLSRAENANLLLLTCSNGIPLVREEEKPSAKENIYSRERGNPYIWLDPENAKIMVREITEGLIKIDPPGKAFYLKNQGVYLMKLDRTEIILQRELKGLTHRTVITQHSVWPYFARRFGLKVAGIIVTQMGTETSSNEVNSLIQLIKKQNIRVIISEPQLSQTIPQMIASKTGAKVVTLSSLTGEIPGTETYISLIEYNVHQIIDAIRD